MTQARCFECNVGLPIVQKSMEELLALPLPIFCCTDCSIKFPTRGTIDFEYRIDELRNQFRKSVSQDDKRRK